MYKMLPNTKIQVSGMPRRGEELNIFEDIEANAVTGYAVLLDNLNLINKLSLQ